MIEPVSVAAPMTKFAELAIRYASSGPAFRSALPKPELLMPMVT